VDVLHLSPTTWGAIAFGAVLAWALLWAWRWYRDWRARTSLVEAITAAGTDHINDVLVPDGMGGFFHVDFLLLTPRGVLVIDLRDVPGNVFGGDQMTEWTVMERQGRFTFPNPQSALYDRMAAVKAVVGDVPVEGRIVFTRRAKFPKGLPKWTLMVDSLRAEFPAVERAALSGTAPRFEEAWGRLKEAVQPSPLA
jgi:hypothetical protein